MEGRRNEIELYYFSGTGNTLFIANKLKERIPHINLKPIVSLLVYPELTPKSKIIGFCFPNHAGHLPIPMKLLIKKLRLAGDEYIFAICNSAFSRCFAPNDINKIIKKYGARLSSYFNILMPDNHSCSMKGFIAHKEDDFSKYVKQVQIDLDFISDILVKKENYYQIDDKPAPFPKFIDRVLVPFIYYLNVRHPATVLKGSLYADSKCVGCKTCEKVCLANRISMKNNRPCFDYKKTCFGCYCCVNYCPEESIQLGSKWYNGKSYTTENRRYSHPFASVTDIVIQKKEIIL
ncbi:MAG: EFR1 family ferrodoxin [Bacteroidota bacterium]